VIGSYPEHGPITPALAAVLNGVARGETAAETARRLHVTPPTVAKQRRAAVARLGARNLASAIAIAYDRGILR